MFLLAKYICSVYKHLVCIFSAIVWLFVGFLLWIPSLIIGYAVYCGALISATLSDKAISPSIEQKLFNANNMYIKGFENIVKTLKEDEIDIQTEGIDILSFDILSKLVVYLLLGVGLLFLIIKKIC